MFALGADGEETGHKTKAEHASDPLREFWMTGVSFGCKNLQIGDPQKS